MQLVFVLFCIVLYCWSFHDFSRFTLFSIVSPTLGFLLLNRPERTPCFNRSRMAPENSAGQAISFFEGLRVCEMPSDSQNHLACGVSVDEDHRAGYLCYW